MYSPDLYLVEVIEKERIRRKYENYTNYLLILAIKFLAVKILFLFPLQSQYYMLLTLCTWK